MVVQSELDESLAIPTDPHHIPTILQSSSSQPQKTHKPRKPKRKDTHVPQPSGPNESVTDEAVIKELSDSLVRAVTTASSLEVKQDSVNINKTQSKATPNEPSSQGTDSGSGPRVESSGDEESLGEDASKQGRRIDAINQDEDITLINVQDVAEMFDVDDLGGEEVFVAEQEVVKDVNENVVEKVVNAAQDTTATTTITIEEITLTQVLKDLKTSKPKEKGKGIMIEEHVKPKKKDQIRLDEEAAKSLQAKFDEEARLVREKVEKEQEANITLIETWDDIQAKIDVDHQLTERLEAQEQEELSDVEKGTLFQQLLEKRRKHFIAKRAEEKRNKPPIQAQKKKIMCTYLKNMEAWFKNAFCDPGRIVRIKSLLDVVGITAAQVFVNTALIKSSSKELFSPLENPKQKFRSMRRLFNTPSLIELNSPEFNQISDIEEQSEEKVRETMTETMEQYMIKTRGDYGCSWHEDANEYIKKVLEIVDLFHILKITQDQIMFQAFHVSLTGVTSKWLRNHPSGLITTCKGAIPSKTATDAKVAIQEMVEFSQKWHNGTSLRSKSIETYNGLTAIQAQLNNLGREIKKVNEKVYAAQYRATGPGFYQWNNGNSSYPDRRPSLEESLTKFMAESAKRHEENSNIIKEIRASIDAAIRNHDSLIKTLEIQIRQMGKVLQKR
nr:hypothetical protein [Tanacetum cinerariifolium]